MTEIEKTVEMFDSAEQMQTALEARNQSEKKVVTGDGAGQGGGATTETRKDTTDQQFNEAEYLRRHFGEGFDSIEKVKSSLVQPIDENVMKLLPDAEFISKNPQAYNLAKIAASNPGRVDTYLKAMKYDLGTMSAFDKIVAKEVLETGVSESDVRLSLQAQYRMLEDEDYTDVEKAQARIQLAKDDKIASEYLAKFQHDAMLPEPQRQLAADEAKKAEDIANIRASWKPEIEKMAGEVSIANKQEFNYHGEKIPVDFKMELSNEDKATFRQIAESLVNNGVFENNAKNKELIKGMAQALFIQSNFNKIASAVGSSVLNSFHSVTGHKFYGVPPKTTEAVDTGAAPKKESTARTPLRASDF